MHIRVMNTNKPTGAVGFLPMEGGNEGGGEGFSAQKTGDPAIKEELVEAPGIIQLLSEEDNRLIAIAKDEGKSTQERFDAAQKIENEVAQNEILYDVAMRNTADGKEPWMASNSFPPAVIKLRIEAAKKIMNESMRKKTLCDMAKAGFLTVDQSLEVLIATNDLELYHNTLSDMAQDIDKKSDARVGFLWKIYDLEKRIHTANNMARDNRQVVFYDDIRSGGIVSIKSILTLERVTSDIKNLALDTLLAIATDSSVFWKYRLESAQAINDNTKKQQAYVSMVTDPNLQTETDNDPEEQEDYYVEARKTITESLPSGEMRDKILRKIVKGWENNRKQRFNFKSFKFLYALASGEVTKESLVNIIKENAITNEEFDKNLEIKMRLEEIKAAIKEAKSEKTSKKHKTLKKIAQSWQLDKKDLKLQDEYIDLFSKLYRLAKDMEEDAKRHLIHDILSNNQLHENFCNAIKETVTDEGDEDLLKTSDIKSARNI